MRSRIALLAAAAAIAALLLAGCRGEAAGGRNDLVQVKVDASQPKALAADAPDDIASWEFKAIPQFASDEAYGETAAWTAITTEDNGDGTMSADLGVYSQGKWEFMLRTLNADGSIVSSGSSGGVFLRKGAANTVTVALAADTGMTGGTQTKGSISFGIETDMLSDAPGDYFIRARIRPVLQDGSLGIWDLVAMDETVGEDGWLAIQGGSADVGNLLSDEQNPNVPDGRTRFYGESAQLSPGAYALKMQVCAMGDHDGSDQTPDQEIAVSGQTLAVSVIGGETSTVKGTLDGGEFIEGGLTIISAGAVIGAITGPDGEPVLSVRTDDLSTASVELQWSAQTDTEILHYYWSVGGDDVADSDASAFVFRPAAYGNFLVSCVAAGSVQGGAMGQLGSSSVIVQVNPGSGD